MLEAGARAAISPTAVDARFLPEADICWSSWRKWNN